MKVGTIVDDVSPAASLELGIRAEKLGFESLWFSDHLIDTGGIKVDPFVTMGAVAARTTTIAMCPAVTDVQRIHPAKLAHVAATLGELSGGRAWLGLGAGEAMNLVPFGIPFDQSPRKRSARLAEAIQVIRLLWGSSSAQPVTLEGCFFTLRDAWLDVPLATKPKLFVGALGGKSALEVAGRYGDGWVSWLNSPETFRSKLDTAKRARASGETFEACVWVYTVVTEDSGEIRRAVNRAKRGLLAEKHTLELMGFRRPEDLGESFQNMLVSPGGSNKFQEAQASVPDELALRCLAAGTPAQIVERIEEFGRAGATRALIHFVGEDPASQIELFASKVLPGLAC